MSRIVRHIYYSQIIRRIDGKLQYYKDPEGKLFYKTYKTNIMSSDLPEWFLYGRYYKQFGYMSTKGIVDMVYEPFNSLGTFLKDDCLIISYRDEIQKIPEKENDRWATASEKYRGYDEVVWGSEILTILKGAREYSGYDINPIVKQIKENWEYVKSKCPQEYGRGSWQFDADKVFAEGIQDYERKRE